MHYTLITTRDDGVSAFEDIEVPLHDRGPIGRISAPIPVASLRFRETPPDHHHDWHPAPQRQFVVLLDGEIEITAGSGEVRRFRGGDVLLVEDTQGRGHLTRHIQQTVRRSLFVTLPEMPGS